MKNRAVQGYPNNPIVFRLSGFFSIHIVVKTCGGLCDFHFNNMLDLSPTLDHFELGSGKSNSVKTTPMDENIEKRKTRHKHVDPTSTNRIVPSYPIITVTTV